MAFVQINKNIRNETDIEYLHHRIALLEKQLANLHESKSENIGVILHSTGTHHLVFSNQIKYVTSESNYSYIFLNSGLKIFTSKTLKYWLDKFESENIIRIHRGIAVNASCISKFIKSDKSILLDDGTLMPYS
jgi:two-component system LytT family response regulator